MNEAKADLARHQVEMIQAGFIGLSVCGMAASIPTLQDFADE